MGPHTNDPVDHLRTYEIEKFLNKRSRRYGKM